MPIASPWESSGVVSIPPVIAPDCSAARTSGSPATCTRVTSVPAKAHLAQGVHGAEVRYRPESDQSYGLPAEIFPAAHVRGASRLWTTMLAPPPIITVSAPLRSALTAESPGNEDKVGVTTEDRPCVARDEPAR